MKFTTTKTHKITFNVQYFEREEGGMDSGYFPGSANTLEGALDLLEKANAVQSNRDWIITLDVVTKIQGAK